MSKDVENVGNSDMVCVDGNVASEIMKKLDANSYATKKTIAQGLLDVALLTANASQLKYVLQVGEEHEFYSLMLGLIITSIILQIVQVLICIFLGTSVNINKTDDTDNANTANNGILFLNMLIVVVNVFISGFEMKESNASASGHTTDSLLRHTTEGFGFSTSR